jgi:hypothetical protein
MRSFAPTTRAYDRAESAVADPASIPVPAAVKNCLRSNTRLEVSFIAIVHQWVFYSQLPQDYMFRSQIVNSRKIRQVHVQRFSPYLGMGHLVESTRNPSARNSIRRCEGPFSRMTRLNENFRPTSNRFHFGRFGRTKVSGRPAKARVRRRPIIFLPA